MGWYDRLYAYLPVWGQNLAVSTFGYYWHILRFGGNYGLFEDGYRQRDKFTIEEWQDYQRSQLRLLMAEAVEHVPHYQRTWNEAQKKAALNGELSELPLLEKQTIRNAPQDFINPTISGRKLTFYTSGTTGTPVSAIYTISDLRDSLAVREVRSANWAGVSFNLPRATFSGRLVEPDPDSNGPYYRYNAAEKQVYFSAFHLRPDTAQNYTHALERYKVQWMTGYAVSFYLLARFVLEKNLPVPSLKAIITTSEKVTPEMRVVMEQAFGCRVYEEYSTVENALFASECEHGRLHISPDVGAVEILRPDGSACEPGEVGEVVATCLMRHVQPLIRYRLGDLAAWDSDPCPCGRSMPVIKEVVGRLEDVVVGPDGRQMVRFHGIFVNQPHIIEGQIIQEALDFIRVKIVPKDSFDETDRADVVHRVQQRLGRGVRVDVDLVSEIPRTKAGKFKAVISKLKQ